MISSLHLSLQKPTLILTVVQQNVYNSHIIYVIVQQNVYNSHIIYLPQIRTNQSNIHNIK